MIYVLSGGGGKAFAVIHAVFPEGSTCTCSNGSKTLEAKGTNGAWNFLVPSAGEWTVSCTDGENTASKTISITGQGQNEEVALSYGFHLYNNGVEVVTPAITLGGGATKKTAYIEVKSYANPTEADWNHHSTSSIAFASFDLSLYSTAKVRFVPKSSTKPDTARFIISATTNPAGTSLTNRPARTEWAWDANKVDKDVVLSLDISEFTTGATLAMGIVPGLVSAANILEVWLEE